MQRRNFRKKRACGLGLNAEMLSNVNEMSAVMPCCDRRQFAGLGDIRKGERTIGQQTAFKEKNVGRSLIKKDLIAFSRQTFAQVGFNFNQIIVFFIKFYLTHSFYRR